MGFHNSEWTSSSKSKRSQPTSDVSGSPSESLQRSPESFPPLAHPYTGGPVDYIPDSDFLSSSIWEALSVKRLADRLPRAESAHWLSEEVPRQRAEGPPMLSQSEQWQHFRNLHLQRFHAARLQREIGSCRGHAGQIEQLKLLWGGAQRTRNFLVESNLRLVLSLASQFVPFAAGVMRDELVSAGYTALMKAVERFDYRRGVRFSTYAYRAIQRAMIGCLSSAGRHQRAMCGEGQAALDAVARDAGACDRKETLAREAASVVQRLLDRLKPRERTILMERFGFGQRDKSRSFREIGEMLGISKQRVASVYAKTLEKLRNDSLSASK